MKKVLIVMGLIFSISLFSSDNSSADWQIKTYSSAAPSFIGDFATVIGGKGETLRKVLMDGLVNMEIQDHFLKQAGNLLMRLCQFVMMTKE